MEIYKREHVNVDLYNRTEFSDSNDERHHRFHSSSYNQNNL